MPAFTRHGLRETKDVDINSWTIARLPMTFQIPLAEAAFGLEKRAEVAFLVRRTSDSSVACAYCKRPTSTRPRRAGSRRPRRTRRRFFRQRRAKQRTTSSIVAMPKERAQQVVERGSDRPVSFLN